MQYLYPQSEAAFHTWEQEQLSGGPVSMVKLAFESLNCYVVHPTRQFVSRADYHGATAAFYSDAAQDESFLHQTRDAVDAGHRFIRFHALGRGRIEHPHDPPHHESSYWRTLALYFTHINGPLAGEEIYAIPHEVNTDVRLSRLPHEMHVVLDTNGQPQGAAGVMYNYAKTRVEQRAFYDAEHEKTRHAATVAWLLFAKVQSSDEYRLPLVRPPKTIEQQIGLQAIDSPLYVQAQDFTDILPPVLRQADAS